jgi:hypothetical protein
MALFLSALGVLPLLFASLWLPWLHAPSEVEAHVACYLRVLALALPGALMFRAIYAVNTAVSRPHVFFDALPTVASFVLRADKLAIAPTVIHAAALWGVGVVGGYPSADSRGPHRGHVADAVDRARAGRAAPGRVLPRTPAVPLVSGAAYDCSGRHRPARPR